MGNQSDLILVSFEFDEQPLLTDFGLAIMTGFYLL